MDDPAPAPSFPAFLRLWTRIGCLGFGGPAGQIALMQRLLVDEHRWIGQQGFLHALNFCMLLPGPEAQQLATWCGWKLHGLRGGLAAGLLFILPGALVMLGLSILYVTLGQVPLVSALLRGVQAAVIAVVLEALLRVARRALRQPGDRMIAAAAFLALFAFRAPFPLVILCAGLFGLWRGQRANNRQPAAHQPAGSGEISPVPALRPWRVLIPGAALWLAPLAVVVLLLGPHHVLADIGRFFAVMAVVTFGGAYAVLSYVAQQAVSVYHWLSPADMLAGLGLAETTPGPLILVLQFTGFLAGYRDPAPFGAMTGGLVASALTLWMTFVPSFVLVLAGAPWIDRLERQPRLAAILAAITAAVVGVILNLSLWFALHVLFARVGALDLGPLHLPMPDLTSFDPRAALIALAAALALLRFHAPLLPTLAGAALAGLLLSSI